jgi:hypothetical protein
MARLNHEWQKAIDALDDFQVHQLAAQEIPPKMDTAHDLGQRAKIEYARAVIKQRESVTQKESLDIARDANRIAADANALSDRANFIAISAAIFSFVSFVVAMLALFKKS